MTPDLVKLDAFVQILQGSDPFDGCRTSILKFHGDPKKQAAWRRILPLRYVAQKRMEAAHDPIHPMSKYSVSQVHAMRGERH